MAGPVDVSSLPAARSPGAAARRRSPSRPGVINGAISVTLASQAGERFQRRSFVACRWGPRRWCNAGPPAWRVRSRRRHRHDVRSVTWSFGPGPATGCARRLELRLVLGPRSDHRIGRSARRSSSGTDIPSHIRAIGRLRQRHQLRGLLAGVFPRQRAVPARVGVHLGAVQRHRAELAPRPPRRTALRSGRENAAGTRRWYRGRDDRWPRCGLPPCG